MSFNLDITQLEEKIHLSRRRKLIEEAATAAAITVIACANSTTAAVNDATPINATAVVYYHPVQVQKHFITLTYN